MRKKMGSAWESVRSHIVVQWSNKGRIHDFSWVMEHPVVNIIMPRVLIAVVTHYSSPALYMEAGETHTKNNRMNDCLNVFVVDCALVFDCIRVNIPSARTVWNSYLESWTAILQDRRSLSRIEKKVTLASSVNNKDGRKNDSITRESFACEIYGAFSFVSNFLSQKCNRNYWMWIFIDKKMVSDSTLLSCERNRNVLTTIQLH